MCIGECQQQSGVLHQLNSSDINRWKLHFTKWQWKKQLFFKIIINCNNVTILGEDQTTKHACKKYMLTKFLDSNWKKRIIHLILCYWTFICLCEGIWGRVKIQSVSRGNIEGGGGVVGGHVVFCVLVVVGVLMLLYITFAIFSW